MKFFLFGIVALLATSSLAENKAPAQPATKPPAIKIAETKSVKVYDIDFSLELNQNNTKLKLVGEPALRSKLFFKVYVLAHYQEISRSHQDIVKNPVDENHFRLIRLVSKRKIAPKDMLSALSDGIKNNVSAEIFTKITPSLNTFNDYFKAQEFKEGTELSLFFQPKIGLEIKLDNKALGQIKDLDFASAIFKVWLGEKPVSNDIKKSLLKA